MCNCTSENLEIPGGPSAFALGASADFYPAKLAPNVDGSDHPGMT